MKYVALALIAAVLPPAAHAQPRIMTERAQPPAIMPAPPGADTCGATPLASLIGQSRSAIPIPVDPTKRRVVCTACPRTMDYRPDRLTVFYDARSGRVTTLQCG